MVDDDDTDGYEPIRKKNYDLLYKVIIIGESQVGKTALLRRYQYPDRALPLNLNSTIGIDYRNADMVIDGLRVRVQLWDTAGQEQFRTMTRNFFTGAKGVMLVFDVTNRESFVLIDDWITGLKQKSLENEEIYLIGNKIDLEFRDVTYEEAEQMARASGMKYFETSARTGENVKETIEKLIYNMKDANHPLKSGSVHIIDGEEWHELFADKADGKKIKLNQKKKDSLKGGNSCCSGYS